MRVRGCETSPEQARFSEMTHGCHGPLGRKAFSRGLYKPGTSRFQPPTSKNRPKEAQTGPCSPGKNLAPHILQDVRKGHRSHICLEVRSLRFRGTEMERPIPVKIPILAKQTRNSLRTRDRLIFPGSRPFSLVALLLSQMRLLASGSTRAQRWGEVCMRR